MPMCWTCCPDWPRGFNSHCSFGGLCPCPKMDAPMAREKSYIFNWIVEASKRPEMIAFPDNTPRFGFVEAYDHFLHVSRTNPNHPANTPLEDLAALIKRRWV